MLCRTDPPLSAVNNPLHSLRVQWVIYSGKWGIRTLDTLTRIPHFECGSFDHSDNFPCFSVQRYYKFCTYANFNTKKRVYSVKILFSRCNAPPIVFTCWTIIYLLPVGVPLRSRSSTMRQRSTREHAYCNIFSNIGD